MIGLTNWHSLGSGYFMHQNQALLDYSKFRKPAPANDSVVDIERADRWRTQADVSTRKVRRPLIMERDLPYFDNRSSFLRHRSSLIRNSKNNQDKGNITSNHHIIDWMNH